MKLHLFNDPDDLFHDVVRWLWWRAKFVMVGVVIGVVLGYAWRFIQTGGHF